MRIAIDAEYNRPSDPDMGLLCVSVMQDDGKGHTFWVEDFAESLKFAEYMKKREGATLLCYYGSLAEVRVLMALGIDPYKYKWHDLSLSWNWLRNKDNRYSYGNLLKVMGGKIVLLQKSVPPVAVAYKKASKEEKDQAKLENLAEAKSQGANSTEEVGKGLLDCLYFFGVLSGEELKDAAIEKAEMHKQIVHGGKEWIQSNKTRIMDYCYTDVSLLFDLEAILKTELAKVLAEPTLFFDFKQPQSMIPFPQGVAEYITPDMVIEKMGNWCCLTGIYGYRGLPLNKKRMDTIRDKAQNILRDLQMAWNEEEDYPLYEVRKSTHRTYPYIRETIVASQELKDIWCKAQEERLNIDWNRTESGQYDTDKKYLETLVAGDDCPIKRYLRHKKAISSITGFAQDGKGIWDSVGSDYVNRPNYNPYGTQTGRNGHKSSSFIFAGPHWTRCVVEPPKGKVLLEFDYGSEEVWIAGCASKDDALMKSYLSADVYWSYMAFTGAVPIEIGIPTEEQRSQEPWAKYAKLRSPYKTIFLSISYGAQAKSLYQAVATSTGNADLTIEDGKKWLREFQEAYPQYAEWKEILLDYYAQGYQLMLPDFYRLGVDNMSPLSTANMPIQGTGSTILRVACKMLYEQGIEVISTMHDAITVLCDEQLADVTAKRVEKLMSDAAKIVLEADGMKVGDAEIVKHGETWLHGRGKADYKRFEKYFS